MEDFQGKYNGNQIDSRLDKVKDMVGATASEAGAAGLVPAPAAGKQAPFLRGDGTWQDIAVHEPGFLSDNFDDENDFRSILFNLAFGGISNLTQSQYNIIASKCEVDTTTQYLLSGSSSTYGIGDVILMRASSGDIQVVLRTGGKGDSEYICYNAVIIISNDLTYTSSVSQYVMQQLNNSTKDIALAISNQSGDNRIINFSTAGSGAKALMDNGLYQDIRGIDISSYLLEPDAIDIVSSITKSEYDDIKSYILNNDHMYLSRVISDSGFTAAFNSDIIASYIYDAAYLVFFDPNSSKMSKIKIDYDTYEVSTIEF